MTSQQLPVRSDFLLSNLDLEEATGIEGARFEPFQLLQIGSDDAFSIYNKSRQIAFSWTEAAKSVARALLEDESTIFVSINLQEAHEKIVYTQRIYETLARRVKLPPLKSETKLGLTFSNGARILSHPSKAPRGKSRFHVVLDEFAHIPTADAQKIYKGSVPILSKGGTLTVGSSPLDANGPFWEIFTETFQSYEQYKRYKIPWYLSFWFCKDPRGALNARNKGATDTQIVDTFGNDRIKVIFDSLQLEDFLVEYCCSFADGSTSWITGNEILSCINAEFHPVTFTVDVTANTNGVELMLKELEQVLHSNSMLNTSILVGAMDIGRRRDSTEILLLKVNVDAKRVPQFTAALFITLRNCPFEQQWAVLERVLPLRNLQKFLIDSTGLGMSLGEKAQTLFPIKVEPKTFTVANKIEWAVDARKAFQQKHLTLPYDKDLIYQIQSIKRRVSASNNVLFDAERTEKGHADKFWVVAMASSAAYSVVNTTDFVVASGRYSVSYTKSGLAVLQKPPVKVPSSARHFPLPRSIQPGSQFVGHAPNIGLRSK